MNLLFIRTIGSVTDFYEALIHLTEHKTELFDGFEFDPNVANPQGYSTLYNTLISKPYDAVISLLFFPEIATMCHELDIYYISWTYDSPLVSLFDASVLHDTNHIFIFDSYECQKLKAYGAKHVYFQPLAANTKRMQTLAITPNDTSLFSNDISFVGSLYENNAYNNIYPYIPSEYIQEWKEYLSKHMCNWNVPRPWPMLSTSSVEFLTNNLPPENIQHFNMNLSEFFGASILSPKLAEIERISALQACATVAPTSLYSGSHCPKIPNLTPKGYVDYYTDMSKVFHLSRINLNVTLPSIVCGTPQRIFDIMACGGFVLTNYQKDLEQQFRIGIDLETFNSLEELTDKARYYLHNEQARLQIALNGYQTVTTHYTFFSQTKKIFKTFQENIA